jgi:hypothetical protein
MTPQEAIATSKKKIEIINSRIRQIEARNLVTETRMRDREDILTGRLFRRICGPNAIVWMHKYALVLKDELIHHRKTKSGVLTCDDRDYNLLLSHLEKLKVEKANNNTSNAS